MWLKARFAPRLATPLDSARTLDSSSLSARANKRGRTLRSDLSRRVVPWDERFGFHKNLIADSHRVANSHRHCAKRAHMEHIARFATEMPMIWLDEDEPLPRIWRHNGHIADIPFVRNGSCTPRGDERKLLSSRESKERKAPPLGGDSSRKLGASDGPQSLPYLSSPRNRCNILRARAIALSSDASNGRFRLKSCSLARRTKGSLPARQKKAAPRTLKCAGFTPRSREYGNGDGDAQVRGSASHANPSLSSN